MRLTDAAYARPQAHDPAGRGAADRRHRRRQRRGARSPPPGTWSRPAGPARSWWPATSRRRDEVGGDPGATCRTCSPTTWCRGSACSRPTRRGPRSARCSWPTSSAASTSAPATDFTAMVRGATPGRRPHRRRAARPRPRRRAAGRGRRGGGRRRRRDHRRAQRRRARPRGRRALSREVVATTPVTRTVEGDLGMRWSAVTTVEAAGLDLADGRSADATTTRASCPTATTRRTWTRRSPPPRRARPAPARRPVARRRRAGRPGGRTHRQGPARGRPARRLRRRAPQRPTRAWPGGSSAGSTGDVEGGWQLPRAPRRGRRPRLRPGGRGTARGAAPRGGVPAGHAAHRRLGSLSP